MRKKSFKILIKAGNCFFAIFLGLLVCQGAPSAPSFSAPNPPSNLGGAAGLPKVDADTAPTSPSAPQPVFEVSGNIKNGFRLRWTAIPAAERYIVERRAGAESWEQVADLSTGVITYLDVNVKANRKYYYRVVPMVYEGSELIRGAALGPRSWRQASVGVMQLRNREGSVERLGFANFTSGQSDKVYSRVNLNVKWINTFTQNEYSKFRWTEYPNLVRHDEYLYDMSIVKEVSDTSAFFRDPISGAVEKEFNGNFSHAYDIFDRYYSDHAPPYFNHYWQEAWSDLGQDGEWSGRMLTPDEDYPISSPEMLYIINLGLGIKQVSENRISNSGTYEHSYSNSESGEWHTRVRSEKKFASYDGSITLSGVLSAKDAVDGITLPDWPDEWNVLGGGGYELKAFLRLNGFRSEGYLPRFHMFEMYYPLQIYGGSGYLVKAAARAILRELQGRLIFPDEPAPSTVKFRVQISEKPEDNPKTEYVEESQKDVKFSYSESTISSTSYDVDLEQYVSSPKRFPVGAIKPDHSYSVRPVYADISVSDYRGLADNIEKRGSAVLVSDPYEALGSPYYVPETYGPSIILDPENPTSANIDVQFGGGFDAAEWTGTLSWSGTSVRVQKITSSGLEDVSSPVQLGKVGEDYQSGLSLLVTAVSGIPGTVQFDLEMRDSQGGIAASDVAYVHLISSTEPEPEPAQPDPDFYTIPLTDATGPKYRKVNLHGRPIPDEQPEDAAESDSAKEESYVDAYSLNLSHSTTDIYVPIHGSDLALSVRRNIQPEIWNFFSGLRPHERPDQPFGSGWSSNLGSAITFSSPTGPDEDGFLAPAEATVIDDDGNQVRFYKYGNYYFPYPSARHEAKMYLSSLTEESGKFVYRQKYGKTLVFAAVAGSQVIADNRAQGGGAGTSYSYARLESVTDRLGYSLQYEYGGPSTLVPRKIKAQRPGGVDIPNHAIYIRQDDKTRCVTAVWDPSGNQISYNYGKYSFSNPKLESGEQQILHYLKQVNLPDTSPVTYSYEGEGTGKPFVIEEDPVPRRNPNDKVNTYQLTVDGISQRVGSDIKYVFRYETDDTRKIYTKVPGFSGYVVQAGAPRRIKEVITPTGEKAYFSPVGSVQVVESGGGPRLIGSRGSTIRDAEGNQTVYRFGGVSIISLDKFKDLFDPEDEVRKPKLVYYTDMTIEASGYGSETYSFDIDAGLSLSRIQDFSGNVTAYTYGNMFTPSNSLFKQILPQGYFKFNDPTSVKRGDLPARQMTYSSNFRILNRNQDENGNATTYTVDTLGRRTSEERRNAGYSAVQTTQYDYDATWKGFITQQSTQSSGDPSWATDLVTNYTPDSSGRIGSKTVNVGGGVTLTTTYLYNLNNSKAYETAPAGTVGSPTSQRTLFTYDKRQRLKRTTFEDDSYKEFSYDGRGRKIAERDENGNITSLGYDANGRLTSKIRRMQTGGDLIERMRYNRVGSLVESTDPRGASTTRKYDGLQRVISLEEPGKGTTQFYYDGRNSGPSIQTPGAFKPTRVVDARKFTTTNTYDRYYRLTRSERAYGQGTQGTRFEYDNVGNKTRQYDGLGKLTKFEYDALNRPTKVINALNDYEETFYTSTGLAWKKRDFRGNETQTEYDGAGRAIKTVFPTVTAGTPVREMEYDRAGNLSKLIDERENETTYTYDARNRQLTETKPEVYDAEDATTASPVTTKAYDAVGNVTDVWDARGVQSRMEYDAANRVIRSYSAYGTGSQISTQTTYDANGNPLTVTDPRGKITTNTYDAANQLVSTTNAEGIVTKFEYDTAGNRTKVTDGKNQSTVLAYDGLNRLIKSTDAVGASEQLVYDAVNKTQRIDSKNQSTRYFYDALNRLTQVSYGDSTNTLINFTYDAGSNILTVDQEGNERDVSYTYDELGRVLTETSNEVQHTYGYDLAGNRTSTTYGGTERVLATTFDALNRAQLVEEGDRLIEYTYTLNGSEASRTLKATGTTVTSKVENTFDVFNRLSNRTGFQVASQIYSYNLGYDANGNVTDIAETYSNGLTNRTLSMVYDDANRLTEENVTANSVLTQTSFTYDTADNCEEKAVIVGSNPAVTHSYSFNSLNQLTGTSFSDSTPAISFEYDANGNRTSRVQNAVRTDYSYDFENRLSAVRLGGVSKTVNIYPVMGATYGTPAQVRYFLTGGVLHEYTYDYRTRRVKRVEDGVTTKVVFSGGTSVSEMTGAATASSPTVEFIRGNDMGGGVGGLLYSDRAGDLSFDHFNSRGDVVAKTDDTGAVTYRAAYEARGKRSQETGSTPDRQKANTKDEDPTGLLNEGFRYRDLETGVFLTRDPAGFVDGPNLYAYVVQNPWTKFDPDGLQTAEAALATNPVGLGTLTAGYAVAVGHANFQVLKEGHSRAQATKNARLAASQARDYQVDHFPEGYSPPASPVSDTTGTPIVSPQSTSESHGSTEPQAPTSSPGKPVENVQAPEEKITPGGPTASDIATDTVNGNSNSSEKPQHVYEIRDANGKLVKVGISGQPLNANGSSPRANPQVKGTDNEANVVETIPGGPGARMAAKRSEQNRVDEYAEQNNGIGPDGNKLPQPTKKP